MRINFDQPILDLDDQPMMEPVARNGHIVPEIIPTRFRTPQEALAAGEPTLNLHPSADGSHLVRHRFDMQVITLMAVATSALTMQWPDEQVDKNAALDRFELALMLKRAARDRAPVVDLTNEQRATIQAATDNYFRVNRTFFARARELLQRAHTDAPGGRRARNH